MKDHEYARKVLESCKTKEQAEVCFRWFINLLKGTRLGTWNLWILTGLAEEKIQELNATGKAG